MGEIMKEASFSLAEAKFAGGGDFNQAVLQNVNKAQIKIKTKNDNVAGVNLPVFESYQVWICQKIYFYNSTQFGLLYAKTQETNWG